MSDECPWCGEETILGVLHERMCPRRQNRETAQPVAQDAPPVPVRLPARKDHAPRRSTPPRPVTPGWRRPPGWEDWGTALTAAEWAEMAKTAEAARFTVAKLKKLGLYGKHLGDG